MKIFFVGLLLISAKAFAIGCDCEVRVYAPMTASHQMSETVLKTYELEEFSSYSARNQRVCRKLCLDQFEKDMPQSRLNALLSNYTQTLINEKVLGHNCTGLTTVKYPVRVKVSLGKLGLGNVADTIQVIDHEELCF